MSLVLYELAADSDRRFSPFCWRSRLALQHKGQTFETVPVRFTEKEKIAFSGQDKAPVLVHGDRIVADSWAIAEYLESAFPDAPSLFGGPAGAALSRFHASWAETVLQPAIFRLVLLDIWRCLPPEDQTYFRTSREARLGTTLEAFCGEPQTQLAGFRTVLAPLTATLQHQPFLGGEAPLYADYAVFGAFMWAASVSPLQLLEDGDTVATWRGRLYESLPRDARALKTAGAL